MSPYRMRTLLEEIAAKTDIRKKDAFLFLSSPDTTDDYSLTIVNDSAGIPEVKGEIKGFKRYLMYWEQNPNKPIILRTGTANFIDASMLRDNIAVMNSAYDYIKRMWKLPCEIKEEFGSAQEWKHLGEYCSSGTDIEAACCKILNVNRFSESLFGLWDTFDTFKKWIRGYGAKRKTVPVT